MGSTPVSGVTLRRPAEEIFSQTVWRSGRSFGKRIRTLPNAFGGTPNATRGTRMLPSVSACFGPACAFVHGLGDAVAVGHQGREFMRAVNVVPVGSL